MPLDDAPKAILVGRVGRAFVHHARGRVLHRPVDHIRVARHPPAVGRTPINVVVFEVEHPLAGGIGLGQIAARRVDDALGFARRAAGVEDVKQIFGIHHLARALRSLVRHHVVPPDVAPLDPIAHRIGGRLDPVGFGALGAGSLEHQHLLDGGTAHRDGVVHGLLKRHDAAAPPPSIRRHHGFGLCIVDPVVERLRAEPAKDHRVRRADAGARQHGDGEFRNHWHVDADSVSLADAKGLQSVGGAADLVLEFGVGDRPRVAWLSLPDDGSLATLPGQDMPVDRVVAGVDLAPDEPLGERGVAPIQGRVPRLEPVQLLRPALPEPDDVGIGLRVDCRVGDVRRSCELGRRGEGAGFLEQSLDGLGHGFEPRVGNDPETILDATALRSPPRSAEPVLALVQPS